jgi:hypothetical protein
VQELQAKVKGLERDVEGWKRSYWAEQSSRVAAEAKLSPPPVKDEVIKALQHGVTLWKNVAYMQALPPGYWAIGSKNCPTMRIMSPLRKSVSRASVWMKRWGR